MPARQFPCTRFKTRKWMDDYHASDMRCGDLSESQLKEHFHLEDASTRANPYTLTKITRQQCAAILFEELRDLSRTFAMYSPYQPPIKQMITHMQ
jgi:Protein of unknown function (DUF3289)